MKLKNGLLLATILVAGFVSAQKEPVQPAPPEEKAVVPPPPPPGPAVKVVKSDVIDFPDVEAEFPGGPEAMKKYIQENVRYPEKARRKGDQGRIYLSFIVEPDGSISTVEVMRGGLTRELNAEAKRLVKNMPRWKPGEVKDKPVRVRCRLPITFVLTK